MKGSAYSARARWGVRIAVLVLLAGWTLPSNAAPAAPVVLYTKDKAPAAPRVEDLPLKESLSQWGITWTFEGRPVHG